MSELTQQEIEARVRKIVERIRKQGRDLRELPGEIERELGIKASINMPKDATMNQVSRAELRKHFKGLK